MGKPLHNQQSRFPFDNLGRLICAVIFLLCGLLSPLPAAAQTGSITGFVVDSVGNRLGGATIRAISGPGAGRQASTAADGTYLLTGLPAGRYIFRATRAGYATDSRTVNVPAFVTSRVDFVLREIPQAGGALEGVITRSGTGQPVPGVLVQLSSSVFSQSTTTNSEGRYRFSNVPVGTYRLQASRVGFNAVARTGINIRNGRTTTLNFAMTSRSSELGILQGTVVDAEGDPLSGVLVRLATGASRGQFDTTNSLGNYQISGIVPDTYTVEFSRADLATATQANVAIGPAQRVVLNAVLLPEAEADASIEGVVFGPVGQLLQGAVVEIIDGPATGAFDVTDSVGVYRIRGLQPGTYTLLANATGFGAVQRFVTVTESANLRVDFVLPSNQLGNGTITGQVTDASGEPVADVGVRITSGPVTGRVTSTDADGDYTILNLPDGLYTVVFSSPGFDDVTVAGIEVERNGIAVRNVTLVGEGGGTGVITGLVTDSDDNPLSGIRVEVLRDAQVVTTVTTNASGRYTASGLATDTYSLRFSGTGFNTELVSDVEVTDGATTTLNVQLDESAASTGTVRGNVIDQAGRSIAGATATLVAPDGDRTQTLTDADGDFLFQNVPIGGPYSVEVTADNLEASTRGPFTVTAGGDINLQFILRSLPGAGSIAGSVRRSNNLPIEGATVRIVAGPARGLTTTTNASGEFNFPALPPGTYGLVATAPGHRAQRRNVIVRAGNASFTIFRLAVQRGSAVLPQVRLRR